MAAENTMITIPLSTSKKAASPVEMMEESGTLASANPAKTHARYSKAN
ncbi:hypothetical protein SAMN04488072_106168 [Lentibacillus halodurans]|uniref:Uncharacterized protein n=1 Tax=Lentibacillus halodurans TaxID=237679 RepID=A0A1I0Y052_9BACI|nr:hypothetical protein SAMN04488072_106168 [Lentibacillus halodurans]